MHGLQYQIYMTLTKKEKRQVALLKHALTLFAGTFTSFMLYPMIQSYGLHTSLLLLSPTTEWEFVELFGLLYFMWRSIGSQNQLATGGRIKFDGDQACKSVCERENFFLRICKDFYFILSALKSFGSGCCCTHLIDGVVVDIRHHRWVLLLSPTNDHINHPSRC